MEDKNISTSKGPRVSKKKGDFKLNPLTLSVNFEKRVSPDIVKMLIENIDDAVAVKMGKYIKVDFNSHKEAAEAKKQLTGMKCEIGQIFVDFASRNKNKHVAEEAEKPAKKAKIEESDIIENKDEEEEEDDEDEEESELGEDEDQDQDESELREEEEEDEEETGEEEEEEDSNEDDSDSDRDDR